MSVQCPTLLIQGFDQYRLQQNQKYPSIVFSKSFKQISSSSQMEVKRINTKKSTHQNHLGLKKHQGHDSGDFQTISESLVSEYSAQESKPRKPMNDRRLTNNFQKQRRAYKSNPNVVLSQIFDVKTIGEMAIFRNLFEGVESWEILEFLSEYQTFLQVLNLQMQDRSLNIDIDAFQKCDFKKDLLYEPVPRTFICGLIRLKELRGQEKSNNDFQVTEAEIKALYVSSLLLINIGEIPKRQRIQRSTESTENYFHRIVSYLLDQSGFLTPKLFYYITINWPKIMEMIIGQFQTDRENNLPKREQKGQRHLNNKFSKLRIQEKTNLSLHVQSSRQQIFQTQNYPDQELMVNEESYQSIVSSCKRVNDIEFKFLSESKPSKNPEKPEKNDKNQQKLEHETNKFKRLSPLTDEQGEIESKKRVKLNSSDPAVQKARKHYNFLQFNTRKRTRSLKGKPKQINVNKNEKKQSQNSANESKKAQQIVEEKKVPENSEEFLPFGPDFQDFFNDYEERYNYRRKDSISSLDYIFSETFRSSSGDEDQIMSSEQQVPENQQDQTEEGALIGIEVEEPVDRNANRKVRHKKRQIDHMINVIIKDRFVMIQSIACQIYHSLKAMNCRLVQRRYYRNLSAQFDRE